MFRLQIEKLNSVVNRQEENFEAALNEIDFIEKRNSLTEEDRLACKLLKSRIYTSLGNTELGLKLAEEGLQASRKMNQQILGVDAIIAKAEALLQLEKLRGKECLELIDQGEHLLSNLNSLTPPERFNREAYLKRYKGIIYRTMGDPDLSFQSLDNCITLFEDLRNNNLIKDTIDQLSLTLDEPERVLAYYEQKSVLYENTNNKEVLAWYHCKMGWYYANYVGNPDMAIQTVLKSQALFEELNDSKEIAMLFNELGELHLRLGEFNLAEDYFKRGLTLSEEIEFNELFAHLHQSFGWFYIEKSEIDLALEYLHKSLVLWKSKCSSTLYLMVFPLSNLGLAYLKKGNLIAAERFFKESLAMSEKYPSSVLFFGISLSLYGLISMAIEINTLDQAKKYLRQLQEIHVNNKYFKPISQMYRISRANLLKTSSRLKDRVKASEILQKVTNEEDLIHTFTIDALFSLSDSLIFELKMMGDEEVLKQLQSLFVRLQKITMKYQFSELQVQTFIIQAQLEIIAGNLSTAMDLLDQASITAEKHELQLLVNKVSLEKRDLTDQLDKWETLIEENAPLKERLERARLEEYISKALKKISTGQQFPDS
ncbi:MAG: tetratricopeptide repeat protein [Promethearchaeota archaeon]